MKRREPIAGRAIADEAWTRYSTTREAFKRGQASIADVQRDREAFDRAQSAIELAPGDDVRRSRFRSRGA